MSMPRIVVPVCSSTALCRVPAQSGKSGSGRRQWAASLVREREKNLSTKIKLKPPINFLMYRVLTRQHTCSSVLGWMVGLRCPEEL